MRKRLVVAVLGLCLLSLTACDKEVPKDVEQSSPSTLEIMQYDVGDVVETKDGLKITLNGITALQDKDVHKGNQMYSIDMTVEAVEKHDDLGAGAFLVSNEGYVSDRDISFKDKSKHEISLNFCVSKDLKDITFTYTGDMSVLWDVHLPELSTVSTA